MEMETMISPDGTKFVKLTDASFVRELTITPTMILEQISLKKGVGAPTHIGYWYHKVSEDRYHSIMSMIEKREIQEALGGQHERNKRSKPVSRL